MTFLLVVLNLQTNLLN